MPQRVQMVTFFSNYPEYSYHVVGVRNAFTEIDIFYFSFSKPGAVGGFVTAGRVAHTVVHRNTLQPA